MHLDVFWNLRSTSRVCQPRRMKFIRATHSFCVVQAPAAAAAAAEPIKSDGPRFEIKKWNAVAMWSWDICADTVSAWMMQAKEDLRIDTSHQSIFCPIVRHLQKFLERAFD